jgi:hypothetical protein
LSAFSGSLIIGIVTGNAVPDAWEVTWQIASETDTGGPAGGTDRHSPGHEIISYEPERNRITYRITTAPDSAGREWTYYVERTTDPISRTAYARRWGNENFSYSFAVWLRDALRARRDRLVISGRELAAERERGVAKGYLSPIVSAAMRRGELHIETEVRWHDEIDALLAEGAPLDGSAAGRLPRGLPPTKPGGDLCRSSRPTASPARSRPASAPWRRCAGST